MKKKNRTWIYTLLLMGFVLVITNSCKKDNTDDPANTVTDIDGNVYHIVNIFTQTWMVENLKVTHYNDGLIIIPTEPDNTKWANLTTAAFCWFNNDVNYKAVYGALYNWYAASNSRLCPTGWHVPSNPEWTTLINNLSGINTAGEKLKETGTSHWTSPNLGAKNSSGFTALPAGDRGVNGVFGDIGLYGTWWSSTGEGTDNAWYLGVRSISADGYNYFGKKSYGFSVRCIKGIPPQ